MSTYEHVYFCPWIGPGYGNQGVAGCKRLLVLGESHYQWKPTPPTSAETNEVVSLWIGGKRKAFSTNTVMAVLGQPVPANEVIRDFWNGVMFYDFVQEHMPESDAPPSADQWGSARLAFFEVIQAHSPEVILVLGQRLWNHLPSRDAHGPVLMNNGDSQVTSYYSTARGQALAGYIHHPSSRGFSSRRWHPLVEQLLRAAA